MSPGPARRKAECNHLCLISHNVSIDVVSLLQLSKVVAAQGSKTQRVLSSFVWFIFQVSRSIHHFLRVCTLLLLLPHLRKVCGTLIIIHYPAQ